MSNQPRRRLLVVATILIAGLLVVAIIVVFPTPGKTETTTSASTTTITGLQTSSAALSASDYNSSLGLELTLSLAQNMVSRDDGISMYLSLDNTLATQNNLSRPGVGNLPYIESCSQVPLGLAVFSGNYDVGNVSEGEPLGLINPYEENVNGCGGIPDSFYLAPLSDELVSPTDDSSPIRPDAANMTYWGYWTGSGGHVFQSFPPGIYTMEGEDWWGQMAVLHFKIVVDQNPFDCTTIASNSSFVGYTNGTVSGGPLKLEAYYQDSRSNNTVVFALSDTGNSTVTLGSIGTDDFAFDLVAVYGFSTQSQVQSYRYYSPNGTLEYPALFYPNECSLISVTLPSPSPHTPFSFFVNNQTQQFTLTP